MNVQQIGLIETMYWQFGKISLWDYHFFRLYKSAMALKIKSDLLRKDHLYEHIKSVVNAQSYKESKKVRLHLVNDKDYVDIRVEVEPFVRRTFEATTIGIANGLIKDFNPQSHLKTDIRHIYNGATAIGIQNNWVDALLLNSEGNIVEGSISNILWREADNQLYTTPLSEGPISGVMREYLMNRNDITEKILSIETLLDAKEVYISNALRGIVPIMHFQNQSYQSKLDEIIY